MNVATPYYLTLHPGAALDRVDGAFRLTHWERRTEFRDASPGVASALEMLAAAGASETALEELVVGIDGLGGLAHWLYTLDVVREAGALQHTLRHGERVIAVMQATAPGGQARLQERVGAEVLRLSRFASLRLHGDRLILSTPISWARLELRDPLALAAMAVLRRPSVPSDVVAAVPEFPQTITEGLIRLLEAAGVVVASAAEEGAERPELEHWGLTDLLFHRRSRWGGHRAPTGGTFPLRGRSAPLPAVKPLMSGQVVELPRLDPRALAAADRPFTEVLERRRSQRRYGASPIALPQLGEFLFRAARVRSIDEAESLPYPISDRPYPSGGACYPLEVYPVIARCAGLRQGIYHYDPLDHRLVRVAEWDERAARLVADARLGEGLGPVQVLLVITARFRRTMWKYEGMAYATILKDVGVLFQTMYLAASAMGLAPCALGCGNADLFAEVVGLDPLEEASVGEFLLGSGPDSS